MSRLKIEYSKDTQEVGNMDVVTYKFSGEDVQKVTENYKLSEERQKEALDKILDAYPNYLDMDQEEQYGLIVSTMTLETLVYWLVGSGKIDKKPSMYNAFMEAGDVANIEFFYIKDEEQAAQVEAAFQSKDNKVIDLPRKAQKETTAKKRPATVHALRKEEEHD